MARLPLVPEAEVPTAMGISYQKASQGETSLPPTFQALFASPVVGHQLVGLDAGLHPNWFRALDQANGGADGVS